MSTKTSAATAAKVLNAITELAKGGALRFTYDESEPGYGSVNVAREDDPCCSMTFWTKGPYANVEPCFAAAGDGRKLARRLFGGGFESWPKHWSEEKPCGECGSRDPEHCPCVTNPATKEA